MSRQGFARTVALVFGVGLLRPAPGTWGSLAALPPAGLLVWGTSPWGLGFYSLLAAVLAFSLFGIWAAGIYVARTGQKDPPEVVIDEVAGQWTALLPLAASSAWEQWHNWALGLLCFRFFDMVKPWPCDSLETLDGGCGVMADDLMAGVYAALALSLLLLAQGAFHA